jgi:putative transposase
VGLSHFATLANGEQVANPRFFREDQKALRRAQRRLQEAEKGTPLRARRRKVVARIHERIVNRRADFAHQLARRLVDRYDLIVFEDLAITRMIKLHSLAKSIQDAAWGQFIQVACDKAAEAGRTVVLVDARHSTQECSGCGGRVVKTLADRVHECPSCGLVLDRDHNAARNILRRGRQTTVGLHSGGSCPASPRL